MSPIGYDSSKWLPSRPSTVHTGTLHGYCTQTRIYIHSGEITNCDPSVQILVGHTKQWNLRIRTTCKVTLHRQGDLLTKWTVTPKETELLWEIQVLCLPACYTSISVSVRLGDWSSIEWQPVIASPHPFWDTTILVQEAGRCNTLWTDLLSP